MSNKVDYIQSLIFKYETTHRSDYRDVKMLQALHATEKVKSIKDLKSTAEKNIEKLSKRKGKSSFKEAEAVMESGRRSLPLLVMPPAVNVDDIEDPRVRQILIKDIYTSSSRRSYNQPTDNSARAPLPSRYTPNNPVALPKVTPPYVALEWRLESVGWDRRQKRANLEPNKVFWQSQNKFEEANKLK